METKPSDRQLQPLVTSFILAFAMTTGIATLVYFNYVIWQDYLEIIAWAFLLSQALYAPQKNILARLQFLRNLPERRRATKTANSNPRFLTILKEELQDHLNSHSPLDLLAALGPRLISYSFFSFTFFLSMSLLPRVFSWVHILGFLLIAVIILGVLIYVLDYHILWFWTPIIADESLAALLLASGALGSLVVVIVFLSIQSTIELYEAVLRGIKWSTETVYEYDYLIPLWNYTVQLGNDAFERLKFGYNNTPWWPVVDTLEVSIAEGRNITVTHQLCRGQLAELYSNTSWWEPADAAVMLMMKEANMGQLVTEAWRLFSAILQETKHDPFEVVRSLLGLVSNPLLYLQSAFWFLTSMLMLASNWGIQLVFFIYFLLIMLNSEDDTLGMGITILVPSGPEQQQHLANTLRCAVQGVFYLPIQLASMNSTIVFITLKVCGMQYAYLVTSTIFITSLLPLFSPKLVLLFICGIMTLPFWISHSMTSLILPILIYTVDSYLFFYLEEKIYSEFERKGWVDSPMLAAFSMALGVANFGWKGVIIGPLLLCVLVVVVKQRLTPDFPAPPPSPVNGFSPVIFVEVALGSAKGTRYRVPVIPGKPWAHWARDVQRRMQLPAVPTEMRTMNGSMINSTDVMVNGETLIIPQPTLARRVRQA